jgi:hypothetical protein
MHASNTTYCIYLCGGWAGEKDGATTRLVVAAPELIVIIKLEGL